MQDDLEIHSLIDGTCMQPQFTDKKFDIDAITIASYFDIVGSVTDVYNNYDGIVNSPATNRFQSFRSITNTLFIYQTLVSKPFFLILHLNEALGSVSEFEIDQRSRAGITGDNVLKYSVIDRRSRTCITKLERFNRTILGVVWRNLQ